MQNIVSKLNQILSEGAPYRESFWKNWLLVVDLLLLFGFSLFLTVWPDWWPDCAVEFEIFSPPREDLRFRLLLLGLAGGNLLTSLLCEMFLADVLVSKLSRRKQNKHQQISRALRSQPDWPQLNTSEVEASSQPSLAASSHHENVKIEEVRQETRTRAFGSLFSL